MPTFDELSEAGKAAALEKYRDWNVADFPWYEYTKNDFHEKLEDLGFSGVDSWFSGFWCQGDGASFKGNFTGATIRHFMRDNKLGKYAITAPLFLREYGHGWHAGTISQSGNYCHDGTMGVEFARPDTDDEEAEAQCDKVIEEIERDFLDWCRSLARQYYEDLEAEYYYQTSDEAVAESLEANEIEIDDVEEDGDDGDLQEAA